MAADSLNSHHASLLSRENAEAITLRHPKIHENLTDSSLGYARGVFGRCDAGRQFHDAYVAEVDFGVFALQADIAPVHYAKMLYFVSLPTH